MSGKADPGGLCQEVISPLQQHQGMSIPESFAIYHGENLFSNGPDGVFRNPATASRVMQKQLLGPQYLSFQQVQRWILDMFKVDKATHKLVLRHIVVVKPNKHQARPFSIVVDIVSLDSWRAFLSLKWRQSEPMALYVQWHAKAVPGPPVCVGGAKKDGATPASAPVPVPVTLADNPAVADQHGGSWPSCDKHGKPCSIDTSWDREDPGRRFYRCPLFKDPGKDCGFTQWLDEEFPEKATKHINSLLSSVESLKQQIENLQEELDELRRRYVTGSSQHAPRDGQDSQARPRQVRKLA